MALSSGTRVSMAKIATASAPATKGRMGAARKAAGGDLMSISLVFPSPAVQELGLAQCQTDLCPSSRSRTREHGEVPLGSAFVEVEDEKGTVAALDFAIAVIWAVPLVEDFDPLDPIHVQTK